MRQNVITQLIQLLKCWLMVMCNRVLLWSIIGPLLLTNAGCRHCSFQCISSVCRACFSDVRVFHGFRKLLVDQTGRRSPNSDHDLLLVKIWLFGSASELLLSPNSDLVISSSHIKSTFI